jgi:hypothetical protein
LSKYREEGKGRVEEKEKKGEGLLLQSREGKRRAGAEENFTKFCSASLKTVRPSTLSEKAKFSEFHLYMAVPRPPLPELVKVMRGKRWVLENRKSGKKPHFNFFSDNTSVFVSKLVDIEKILTCSPGLSYRFNYYAANCMFSTLQFVAVRPSLSLLLPRSSLAPPSFLPRSSLVPPSFLSPFSFLPHSLPRCPFLASPSSALLLLDGSPPLPRFSPPIPLLIPPPYLLPEKSKTQTNKRSLKIRINEKHTRDSRNSGKEKKGGNREEDGKKERGGGKGRGELY